LPDGLKEDKCRGKAMKPTLTDDILAETVRRIVDTAHPKKIILFGSAARRERVVATK
jgi:hypothetical protein